MDSLFAVHAIESLARIPWNLSRLTRALGLPDRPDVGTLLRHAKRQLASGRLKLVRRPVVLVDPLARPPLTPEERAAKRRTWIEVQLFDEDGRPMEGTDYDLRLPTGETRQGKLDSQGVARVSEIDPGECVVWFHPPPLEPQRPKAPAIDWTLRLHLYDPTSRPMPGTSYRLTVEPGLVFEGKADNEGRIEVQLEVEELPDRCRIEWGENYRYRSTFHARFEQEGTKRRLHNLGYSEPGEGENLDNFHQDHDVENVLADWHDAGRLEPVKEVAVG